MGGLHPQCGILQENLQIPFNQHTQQQNGTSPPLVDELLSSIKPHTHTVANVPFWHCGMVHLPITRNKYVAPRLLFVSLPWYARVRITRTMYVVATHATSMLLYLITSLQVPTHPPHDWQSIVSMTRMCMHVDVLACCVCFAPPLGAHPISTHTTAQCHLNIQSTQAPHTQHQNCNLASKPPKQHPHSSRMTNQHPINPKIA